MSFPNGGAVQIWRDGDTYNPKKSELRAWGADVETRVEDLEATTTTGARYIRDTLLDLQAIAAPADGDIGFVINDDSNTATWQYQTGAWVQVATLPYAVSGLGLFATAAQGALAETAVQPSGLAPFEVLSRVVGSPLVMRRPILLDGQDMLGGGTAIYIPYVLTWRHAEVGDFTIVLPQDPHLSDWHKVEITPTAAAQTVYLDAQSQTVHVAASDLVPIQPGRFFQLITVFGSSQERGEGHSSAYAVQSLEGMGAQILSAAGPLRFDPGARELWVPRLDGVSYAGGAWTLGEAAPFQGWRVISLPASDHWQLWVDTWEIAKNGNAAANALKLRTNPYPASIGGAEVLNRQGHGGLVLIASGRGSVVNPASGMTVARIVENQFDLGSLDIDKADKWSSTIAFRDLTDPVLTAMGLTRGVTSTAIADKTVFAGGDLLHGARGWVVTRFRLESANPVTPENPDVFGTPRVYFQYRVEDGTAEGRFLYDSVDITEFRALSSTAREYYAVIRVPEDEPQYQRFLVGGYFGSEDVAAAGIQFASVLDPSSWIMAEDMPRAGETLHARVAELERLAGDLYDPADFTIFPELCMITGRSMTLYPDQLARKDMGGSLRAVVRGVDLDPTVSPWQATSCGGSIQLGDHVTGDTAEIWLEDRTSDSTDAHFRSLPITRATPSEVAALDVSGLSLGDSLTDAYTWAHVVARLRAWGSTITPVGTISNASKVPGDPNVLGEGRGGTGWADFLGFKTDEMAVPASAAAYLAESNSGRKSLNPFLRPATGSDDPAMVNGGVIFDMGYYLDTYQGGVAPDFIWLAHGFNDVTDNFHDADGIAAIYGAGLLHILMSCRDAAPDALLVVPFWSIGRFIRNVRWDQNQWTALRQTLATLRTFDDANTVFIPGYALGSRDAFQYVADEVDPTGTVRVVEYDNTHPSVIGTAGVGEVCAQFIGAKLAG